MAPIHNYHDIANHANAHRSELLRQSEQARLAAEVASSNTNPFYAPALARVGTLLVNIGSELQTRYGEVYREVSEMPEAVAEVITESQAQLAR